MNLASRAHVFPSLAQSLLVARVIVGSHVEDRSNCTPLLLSDQTVPVSIAPAPALDLGAPDSACCSCGRQQAAAARHWCDAKLRAATVQHGCDPKPGACGTALLRREAECGCGKMLSCDMMRAAGCAALLLRDTLCVMFPSYGYRTALVLQCGCLGGWRVILFSGDFVDVARRGGTPRKAIQDSRRMKVSIR